MDALELSYQIKQTTAFIKADQWAIQFHRKTEVSDGAGGRTETITVLAAQNVRIVPARTRSTSLTYTLPTGEVISSKDMFLLGLPGLDVKRLDYFTWQGKAFQISFVNPDRTYQTICQLDEMGLDERSTN